MDCKDAILYMHDYLDGELEGGTAADLKGHITGCPGCRERFHKLEKTGAIVSSLKSVTVPDHITNAWIMQGIPAPARRKVWMKWLRRHPAASVAAVFFLVMMGSFFSLWNNDTQLVVKGSDLEQVVIKGNTVVIPEDRTFQGNLIVENGDIRVDGKINGNLVVIDGSYALASTAQISGEITKVNQAVQWLWYQVNQFFSMLAK